ncbi:MAG: hypothetical protein AAFZ65_04145 [Planctomycetota bacterium]
MHSAEEVSGVERDGRTATLVRSALSLAAAAAVASLLPSCGGGRAPVQQFETVRITAGSGPELRFGVSSSERFGFGLTGLGSGHAPGDGHDHGSELSGSDGSAGGSAAGLIWDLPEGWREIAPTSMRTANFEPRPGTDATAYLTLLAGEGGGLAANVNRWRNQVGLPDLSPAELAALPRQPFLDGDAVRVDFEGTFSGMSGDRANDGYRIVGLLRITEAGSAFLKFVGPSAIVQEELGAFDRLAFSFRPESQAAAVESPPDGSDLGSNSRAGSDAIRWSVPEGWTRMPDRMMREVTFQTGEVECYVASLPGDAGGVRANFDRWRGQLGAAPLSEAEFEGLPSLPMLGATARVIEIDGDFTGMRGETVTRARMLGAVCFLGDRTVFVKMIGPADQVEQQSEPFEAFCQSLELTR